MAFLTAQHLSVFSKSLTRLSCTAIFCALFGLAGLPEATAQSTAKAEGPGTEVVKTANETIRRLLRQEAPKGSKKEKALAAKVIKSVRGFLDVSELGKRAMRDHWSSLKKPQKKAFLAVLTELIETNYIRGLRANLEYDVTYKSEEKKAEQVWVETEIRGKEQNARAISVGYVLHSEKKSGKKLRAYDVITDGVGLVENYRSMFNSIIQKEGFDGLLARMKAKRDALSEEP